MPDIDFVIAWVDGSDPVHAEKRRRFSPDSENAHRGTSSEARLQESGEIYYLIASILKYAPFVRRVFIVTDDQKPAFLDSFAACGLCAPDFLQIVSHDVIFRGTDASRPTFNSLSIEAVLWRIPDLAEHFVYLNDDFFLNAPAMPEDFFRDGKPVIHGTMTTPNGRRLKTRLRRLAHRLLGHFNVDRLLNEPPSPEHVFHDGRPSVHRAKPKSDRRGLRTRLRKLWRRLLGNAGDMRPNFPLVQEEGARVAGIKGKFLLVHHHPHPMRRSTAEAFHAERPEVLRAQVGYRFRNIAQYLPASLSNHLEHVRHGVPFLAQRPVTYMRSNSRKPIENALNMIRDGTTPFGCVQHLDKFPPAARERIHAVLREKFRETLPPLLKDLASKVESV